MKRILLSITLAVIVLNAFGQVPGFMGRKHQFMYSPTISPYTNQFSAVQWKVLSMFRLSHDVRYEYVVKKRGMIGASYNFHQSDIRMVEGYPYPESVAYGEFTRHMVGLHYKRYFGQHTLAPLGFYMKYQFGVIKYNAVVTRGEIDGANETSSWDFAYGMGFGRQFIVGRYIPLEFSLDLNLPLIAISNSFGGYGNDIYTAAHNETLASTMVQFRMAIGILPF